MSKNIIQSIVIFLGILIIIAFLSLIYGMYLKISTPSINLLDASIDFSSQLKDNEKIKNIEVINKDKLLILIESDKKLKGAIYDINNNEIIRFISR
jgi:uncharacterized membrane protein